MYKKGGNSITAYNIYVPEMYNDTGFFFRFESSQLLASWIMNESAMPVLGCSREVIGYREDTKSPFTVNCRKVRLLHNKMAVFPLMRCYSGREDEFDNKEDVTNWLEGLEACHLHIHSLDYQKEKPFHYSTVLRSQFVYNHFQVRHGAFIVDGYPVHLQSGQYGSSVVTKQWNDEDLGRLPVPDGAIEICDELRCLAQMY